MCSFGNNIVYFQANSEEVAKVYGLTLTLTARKSEKSLVCDEKIMKGHPCFQRSYKYGLSLWPKRARARAYDLKYIESK